MDVRPVVVFTANDRPHYMRRVLESWGAVRGIGDALLMFQAEPCPPMLELIREVSFAETIIRVNGARAGCEANTGQAIAAGFAGTARFVIHAEDDILVSEDILEYMAWAGGEYEADERVFGVCSHQDRPPGDLAMVCRVDWFYPWAWGTWRDRWDQVAATWPARPGVGSWDYYLLEQMRRRGQVVIQPAATRCESIGDYGTYQHESMQVLRDRQQFTPRVGPQQYWQAVGVFGSTGERLR